MTAAGPRVRVLICEDSDDDALLIATNLRRGGLAVDYERAERAQQVAEALRERTPDLVISDYHIPGFGAEEALQLLRDSGYDLPFILVSGRIGEEQAANLMRAGAHDFVLKDRMSRLVPVVGRELQQAQERRDRRALQQQLRQAERLDSLGRLAGGIAHDFNNLLAVILGHTDLALADLPEDDPHREGLTVIRDLAERGSALTRHLLVFSRHESVNPETLDANDIVADTERVLRGAIGEDVEFTTRLADGLWPVHIDRSELERLLLNLVANSRRAMPRGGRLVIQTANVPGEQPMVRISVADTGTGMSEEIKGHAFEPFYTTDAATGTGLGLSTAYGTVKSAGGDIALYSRPGGGTTVRIDLPAHRTPAGRPTPDSPRLEPGHGEHLLVVEDDDAVRDLVGLMVRRGGYEAVCLPTPAAALDVIRREHASFDALVTDMVMAGMTGLELARVARTYMPELPVLIMSGYTAGTLPDGEALPEGMALIRKPFTKDALLHAVAQVLGGAPDEV
ncbi:MAG TPA: response regulator [Actinospica sp.]|nr:response regulator [Actinospica sp.]